jgi:glycosyltransferase involved in cell wall biosynthesis
LPKNNSKIIYITPYYEPAYHFGGPVRSSSALCKGLVKNGINISVLTTNANLGGSRLNLPIEEENIINGVPVTYFPIISEKYFFSPKLVQAIKKNLPSCYLVFIQALMTHAFYPAAKEALRNRIPYIVPLRGQLLPWNLSFKPIRKNIYMYLVGRKYLNLATAIYCTNPFEVEALRELGITSKTITTNNIVDSVFFSTSQEKAYLRKKFRIPEQHKIILYVGRLHPVKRPDVAIESLPDDDQIHLVIIGPDETNMIPALRKLVMRRGIQNRVHFTGLLDQNDIIRSMVDSDLLIMTSEPGSENFGMTAAEALAIGLPTITTNSVPTGRMAESVGAGITVPFNSEKFKFQIEQIIYDSEKLQNMSEKGKILAKNEFDSDVIVRKMIDQIENLLLSSH